MNDDYSIHRPATGARRWGLVVIGCLGLAGLLLAVMWGGDFFAERGKQAAKVVILDAVDVRGDKIAPGFHVQGSGVVFESAQPGALLPKKMLLPVLGADPGTFRSFPQVFPTGEKRITFGADARQVFFHADGTIGTLDAAPDTFRLIDEAGRYSCDAENVYYQAIKIPGANPAAFRRLKGDFSVDDSQAFLGQIPLAADAKTFRAYSEGRLGEAWFSGQPAPSANLTMAGWYGDAAAVYFGKRRMDEIDVATFRYLGFRDYAQDERGVYFGAKKIEGVDAATFQVLGTKHQKAFPPSVANPAGEGPDARDANRWYTRGQVYQGAIPR